MDIFTCLCISSFFGFAGVAVGIALVRWFDRVGEEIDYLRKKEEELKELETRLESKARREPDELSLLLMKEQRLAYEAEEERAKKRAAGAGVKSHTDLPECLFSGCPNPKEMRTTMLTNEAICAALKEREKKEE